MAAHKYWRIYITANNGDASYTDVNELQFRTTAGVASVPTGGTPLSSANNYTGPAAAFDNNSATCYLSQAGVPNWVGYYFPTAIDPVEVSVVSPLVNEAARAPKDFLIQYSDDGVNWYTTNAITGQTAWTTAQQRLFKAYKASLSGKLFEYSAIDTWKVTAKVCGSDAIAGSTITTGNTYTINCNTTEACSIILEPKINYAWSASKPVQVGDFMVSSLPATNPYLWKCTSETGDWYRQYGSLHLHFDGANASTTFTDSSINPKTATVLGNAQISTAQSVFNGASALFDGTGDGISFANSADFNLPGDFTLSFRLWYSSLTGYQTIFAYGYNSGGLMANSLLLQTGSGNGLISVFINGSAIITETVAPQLNTWMDYELTRVGTLVTLRKNGNVVGTGTSSIQISTTDVLMIGCRSDGAYGFNGRMDEFQLLKGIARHTSDYTSAAAPFANVQGGTSNGSEPALSTTGPTTDNTVTWTPVAHLENIIAVGPRIPVLL